MLSKRGLGGSWAGFWLDSEGFGRGLGRILGGFWEGLGRLWESFWIGFGFQKKKVLERFGEANPEKHFFLVVLLLESFLQNRGSKKGPFFSRLLGKKYVWSQWLPPRASLLQLS